MRVRKDLSSASSSTTPFPSGGRKAGSIEEDAMSEEIAKCAWRCPQKVDVIPDGQVIHSCEIEGFTTHTNVPSWNDTQARILAARRRDFGAGYLSCSNGSFVLGEIDGKWRDYVERRDDLEFSEHGT